MCRYFLKKLVIIFLAFYVPLPSMAWGVLGHRIVAQIAESYLSSDARKEVKDLLGDESMAMSSNWMDFIKSDTSYKYLSSWHYIDLKPGTSKEEFQSYLATDTATDAYTKILFATAQLKNKVLSRETRAMYLRILIHLVGDIHQPMHVGHPDDQGGNKIKLSWFNENANLHQVWDDRLINFQQLSYTEYAAAINHIKKAERKALQKQPLGEWLWDSYQLAGGIYADIKPDDKLGYNYNFKYISTVNGQLLKAGIHLAGLLNDIFD